MRTEFIPGLGLDPITYQRQRAEGLQQHGSLGAWAVQVAEGYRVERAHLRSPKLSATTLSSRQAEAVRLRKHADWAIQEGLSIIDALGQFDESVKPKPSLHIMKQTSDLIPLARVGELEQGVVIQVRSQARTFVLPIPLSIVLRPHITDYSVSPPRERPAVVEGPPVGVHYDLNTSSFLYPHGLSPELSIATLSSILIAVKAAVAEN